MKSEAALKIIQVRSIGDEVIANSEAHVHPVTNRLNMETQEMNK